MSKIRGNIVGTTMNPEKIAERIGGGGSIDIIDKLCPAFTESGSAVTCEPVEGFPLGVVSHIEPIQEGSGDPSPGGQNLFSDTSYLDESKWFKDWTSGGDAFFAFFISDNVPSGDYCFSGYAGNGVTLGHRNVDSECYTNWYDVTGEFSVNISVDETCNDLILMVYADHEEGGNVVADVIGGLQSLQLAKGSPANIRPIKGHTGCKLWHGGKNLVKLTAATKSMHGVTWTLRDDGSVTINGTTEKEYTVAYYIPLDREYLKDGQVYCVQPETDSIKHQIRYTDENGKKQFTRTNLVWRDAYTVPEYQIYLPKLGDTFDNVVVYPQLEVGSTPTAYEPYRGDTFTIDFEQSVYGGSFHWATGELVIDRKMITLDGTEPWMIASTNTSDKYKYNINAKTVEKFSGIETAPGSGILDSKLMCSILPAMTGNSVHTCHDGISTNQYLLSAYSEQYSDGNLAGFKEMTKGAQIVFGLAEPITIQLTPQEILALSGTNTLYSDTGKTIVNGKADPTAIIENLQKRLAALEAAVVNNM